MSPAFLIIDFSDTRFDDIGNCCSLFSECFLYGGEICQVFSVDIAKQLPEVIFFVSVIEINIFGSLGVSEQMSIENFNQRVSGRELEFPGQFNRREAADKYLVCLLRYEGRIGVQFDEGVGSDVFRDFHNK